MASFATLRNELADSITGVNRYNPNNVTILEQCIKAMIDENEYDQDVVLTTLKLYQLNPDRYNEETVRYVLLKTLMSFPRSDFALAKYLIDTNRLNSPELRRILDIGALLESCDFALFWKIMRGEYKPVDDIDRFKNAPEIVKTIKSVNGFEEAVRIYTCQVINITFQRIEKSQLSRLLGGANDAKIMEYTKRFGWTTEADGTIFVQNHEATIKTRNIEEKLEFGAIKDILRNIG